MRTFFLAAMVGALVVSSCAANYPQEYDNDYDTYDQYDEGDGPQVGIFADLNYYGDWYHVGAYGWVWRPAVAGGWRPFYYGHWVWTDYDWMWVSYEPFGWATCHYGNWTYDFRLGWIWIPGYAWSPAPVEWVVYSDYVCWAPLPPRGVHVGRPWSPGRVNVWMSVRADHFTDTNVGRYRVTKFKSGYADRQAVFSAPERQFVERHEGKSIRSTPVEIQSSRKDGREVRRVKLPPEQTRVVEKHRVQTRPVKSREPGKSYQPEPRKAKKSRGSGKHDRGHGGGHGND